MEDDEKNDEQKEQDSNTSAGLVGAATGFLGILTLGPVGGIVAGILGAAATKAMTNRKDEDDDDN